MLHDGGDMGRFGEIWGGGGTVLHDGGDKERYGEIWGGGGTVLHDGGGVVEEVALLHQLHELVHVDRAGAVGVLRVEERGQEPWGDVGRYGRCGETWGDTGRRGETWGDVGRCEEMWGDVRRCGEMWGDVGRFREMWGPWRGRGR